MKKILLLIFLYAFTSSAWGQTLTLSGFILEKGSKEPIPGVAIFLDGTTKSTISDANGYYTLTLKQTVNTNLIFRHIAYETVSVPPPFSSISDTLFLKANNYQIDEIVVTPFTFFSRTDMMKAFRSNFLGAGKAGKLCKIENEDDIRFSYDTKTNTLRAFCDHPIRITNDYLGYEILFTLTEFSLTYKTKSLRDRNLVQSCYLGYSSFIDIAPDTKEIKKRRDEEYYESFRFFCFSLSQDRLEELPYLIYPIKANMTLTRYNANDLSMAGSISELGFIVKDTEGGKQLYINNLEPEYGRYARSPQPHKVFSTLHLSESRINPANRSTIFFLDRSYWIDPYGNIDPIDKVMQTGNMGAKTIGESLPIDYMP